MLRAAAIQPHPLRVHLSPSQKSSTHRIPLSDISNLAEPPSQLTIKKPNPIPPGFQSLLCYNHDWNIFICRLCKHAISGPDLGASNHHLHKKHKKGYKERKLLWEEVKHLPGAQRGGLNSEGKYIFKDHLPKVPNGTPAIEGLEAPFKGFQCEVCEGYLTISKDLMVGHLNSVHLKDLLHECSYRNVRLQCWSRSKNGNGYWVVADATPTPTPIAGDPITTSSAPRNIHRFAELKMQAEQDRIERQNQKYMMAPETSERTKEDDTDEWLKLTGWQNKFQGKKLGVIAETRFLQRRNGQKPRRFVIHEHDILILHRAFDLIMAWGFDTLSSTHPVFCQWLRSCWTDSKGTNKLQRLMKQASESRYIGYYHHMITYFFRTALMPDKKRETEHGIKFTLRQLNLIRKIHAMLKAENFADVLNNPSFAVHKEYDDDLDDAAPLDLAYGNNDKAPFDPDNLIDRYGDDDLDEGDVDEDDSIIETQGSGQTSLEESERTPGQLDPFERLAETLLELCYELIKQPFDDPAESPLCHFAAVLGISRTKHNSYVFRPPHLYTPMMAGILWVNRILALEIALPKRCYQSLGWKSRSSIPPQNRLDRLHEVRHQCLVSDSYTATAHIGYLMSEGMRIARLKGCQPRVRWENGIVSIDNVDYNPDDIKKMIHDIIAVATAIMDEELLFGSAVTPTVDLKKLRDEVKQNIPGHWVLEELAKSGTGGAQFMIQFAQAIHDDKSLVGENGNDWDWDRVVEYLDRKKMFLELIMLAIFLTGGQPPRGPEIGTIKFRNTLGSIRNLLVDKTGLIYSFVSYRKRRASSYDTQHVARFFPAEVGRLVMLYLTYVRPFAHSLYNDLQRAKGKSTIDDDGNYLFCDDGEPAKCWMGARLSKILVRESKGRLGVKINISTWRHLAIGMAKEIVKPMIAAHFAKDDVQCKEQISGSLMHQLQTWFAAQATHSLGTEIQHYAIDHAYPATLQKDALDWFRFVSRTWQCYLGFPPDDGDKFDRGAFMGKKRGREEEPMTPTEKILGMNSPSAKRRREEGRKSLMTPLKLNEVANNYEEVDTMSLLMNNLREAKGKYETARGDVERAKKALHAHLGADLEVTD